MLYTYKSMLMLAAVLAATAFTPALEDAEVTPRQQLFIIKEVMPKLERLGIVWNKNVGDSEEISKLQAIATSMQVQLYLAEVTTLAEVAPQFRALTRDYKVQGIWIMQNDDLLDSDNGRGFLIKSAIKAGMPLFAPNEGWVSEGAFIAMKKEESGVSLVVNKAAADALSLAVPEKYMERTQFLAAN